MTNIPKIDGEKLNKLIKGEINEQTSISHN